MIGGWGRQCGGAVVISGETFTGNCLHWTAPRNPMAIRSRQSRGAYGALPTRVTLSRIRESSVERITALIRRPLWGALALCLIIQSAAAAQCSAQSSVAEPISPTVIAAVKARLKVRLTLTEAQQELLGEVDVVQKKKADDGGEALAETKSTWWGDAYWVIYTDALFGLIRGPGIPAQTPPDPAGLEEALLIVLEHEFWHLEQDDSGVPPAGGSGVPGGKDCRHMGLQLHSVMQACVAAAAATNPDIRVMLCQLFDGLRAVLKERRGVIRQCRLDGHGEIPGPPSWGLPKIPSPADYPCEVCGD